MISDASEFEATQTATYDVCIVGSGPAGITLALELNKAGLNVCLLEAGGNEGPNRLSEILKSGNTNHGHWYNLEGSRLIQLGGTSGHWSGYCAPLDDEDFMANGLSEARWPITAADLSKYDQRTSDILELGSLKATELHEPKKIHFKDTIQEKMWRFSTPVRFAGKYREALENSSIMVLLGALVRKIEFDDANSNSVASVEVVNQAQQVFRIESRKFILCQGCVETTRFLLTNEDQLKPRMAKSFDFVGRYFAEHPHFINFGKVLLYGENAQSERYRHYTVDTYGYSHFFQIERNTRKKLQLNNLVFRLDWDVEHDDFSKGFEDFLDQHGLKKSGTRLAALSIMAEQMPNEESRIFLKRDQNEYGLNHIGLQWKLTENDLETYRKSVDLFARKLGASGLGRVFLAEKYRSERLTKQLYGGNHHMGTTRMSEQGHTGVTDMHGKVWGIDNLFICGSALFPTYGAANPTYTIVRLALRMARHLSSDFKSQALPEK